jgi:hypothetical protein
MDADIGFAHLDLIYMKGTYTIRVNITVLVIIITNL